MNRQRLIILSVLALLLVGATVLYFRQVYDESRTRFRTGYDIPRDIIPSDLITTEIVTPEEPVAPEIRDTDPLLAGNPNSPVTLIVFGDFQSDLSRQQATAIYASLKSADVGGNVRVVWRDLPVIRDHSKALPSAIAGRCAARQEKFKQMHDELFSNAVAYDDMEFLRMARKINLEEEEFSICVNDPAIVFNIDRDIEDALRHGVTEVPMIFINGLAYPGYSDAETLTEILRYELSKAQSQ